MKMANKDSFETKMKNLETIVSNLEKGELPLEDSLKEFQKGIQISSELQNELKTAEETLTKIMQDNGEETTFNLEDSDKE